MPKRRTSQDPYEEKHFFCHHCYFVTKDRRSKEFKGKHYFRRKTNVYVCQGLKQHLSHSRQCQIYYDNHVELQDFQSSIVENKRQRLLQNRTLTASDIGVFRQSTAVAGLAEASHRPLNQQVYFNVNRPPLDKEVIDAVFYDPNDSSMSLANDDDNDDESLVSNSADSIDSDCSFVNHIPAYSVRLFEKLTRQLIAEVELLNILQRNNLPLNTFKFVMDWAARNTTSSHGNNRNQNSFSLSSRGREAAIKHLREYIPCVHYTFKAHAINWLPDGKLVQVYVRSFRQALFSLLTNPVLVKEEHFSFPLKNTPFLPDGFKLNKDEPISELHHGKWWTQSWKEKCSDPEEILVPIILYMDGISLDVKGNLNLCPLNMTLGIFNTETRKQAKAWETLYFHPDKISSKSKVEGIHNVKNLHQGLEVALKELRDICDKEISISWDGLPYASKKWSVKMRFAIAYVIGDTELHDKLCCRYGNRQTGKICRHCRCDPENLANPRDQAHRNGLWLPSDFVVDRDDYERNDFAKFKSMSHHRVDNVFHSFDFGCNENNIHMATPGECLHMHQLGIAKRTVESFDYLISDAESPKFESLARFLGGSIGRQSDRNFPRTQFGLNGKILSSKMKEGKDYAGMLLCILLSLLSLDGQKAIEDSIQRSAVFDVKKQVHFIELVLGMEEFLKYGRPTLRDVSRLSKMMRYFVKQITINCHRPTGMGNNVIKNHLFLHIPDYIKRWGPPTGWDSAPSESHHKTEIKGPSKNTQRNASSLIKQTCRRKSEMKVLTVASALYSNCIYQESAKTEVVAEHRLKGTSGRIFESGEDKLPSMEWKSKRNKDKPKYPSAVIKFCCKHVLPIVNRNDLIVKTEHYRVDGDQRTYLFCASPSYRAKSSGQDSAVWYDWAIFALENGQIPCQILCFVLIEDLKPGTQFVKGYEVPNNGNYAVVRKLEEPPSNIEGSSFVKSGRLSKHLYLIECDAIESEVAVVPNPNSRSVADDKVFVVSNRTDWLSTFNTWMNRL